MKHYYKTAAFLTSALIGLTGCSSPQPVMQLSPVEQTTPVQSSSAPDHILSPTSTPVSSPTPTPKATSSPTPKPTSRPTSIPSSTPAPTRKPVVLTEEKKEELNRLPVKEESKQEDTVIQESRPTAPPMIDTVPSPNKNPSSTSSPTPMITPSPSPTKSPSATLTPSPTLTPRPSPTPTAPSFPTQTGWYENQKGQYYLVEGIPITGWQVISGRRYHFGEDGIRTSRTGIDVSSYQGTINWKKVANDDISFAFLRIGGQYYRKEGGFYSDTYFEKNYTGATTNGVDIGVYFFSQAITPEEAQQEALWVINQLNGRPLDLPIVYDLEDPAADSRFHLANLNRQQVTDLALAFCETIQANGYEAAVYTNPSWIRNTLYLDQLLQYPLWLAHYTTNLLPSGSDSWTWWQYTSSGTVDGISGKTDLNVIR